jgi:hypothetical protein
MLFLDLHQPHCYHLLNRRKLGGCTFGYLPDVVVGEIEFVLVLLGHLDASYHIIAKLEITITRKSCDGVDFCCGRGPTWNFRKGRCRALTDH